MQYDNISAVYDKFNNDFDYGKYLDTVFNKFPLKKRGLVLDCGCGTGVLLEHLCNMGYDCTGVDGSENMLTEARARFEEREDAPNFVLQNLEDIDMYGAYDIIFCTLDTVNHILSKRNLQRFFRSIYNFTEPGGCFVFDFKTHWAFENSLQPNICDEDDATLIVRGQFNGTYAWYDFTVFEKTGNDYTRFDDTVEERYYPEEDIKSMLKNAGFTYVGKVTRKNRIIVCVRKDEY